MGSLTGQALLGRFRIESQLGAGGMGVVYRATDLQREGVVALKTLERLDGAGIYRLKHEFRALAELSHRNLVRLYDLFGDDDRWFFTMELVEGWPLDVYLRGEHQLAMADTVRESQLSGEAAARDARLRDCLRQLTVGVQAIHEAGKLHRDLKPQNVLADRRGRLTILDFGLARAAGSDSYDALERCVVGTPGYMAPEQLVAGGGVQASDWYAVGAILFELLTGRAPFEGSPHDILRAQRRGETPLHPLAIDEGLAPDLAELCFALLSQEPDQRPSAEHILRICDAMGGLGPPRLQAEHKGHRSPTVAPVERTFVGRERELAQLHEHYQQVLRGEPQLVFVAGVSGIGKSMLIDEALARLDGEPVILRGRCYERESVPFKAFDAVMDALTAYLADLSPVAAALLVPRHAAELCALFPVLEQVEVLAHEARVARRAIDPQERRKRGFVALRSLLARIAERQPLIVTIDDLQWGDTDSGLLLNSLVMPPDPPALLLLGSYRSDEAEHSGLLQQLRRGEPDVQLHRIELEAFAPREARDLAHTLAAREPDNSRAEQLDRLVRASEGSPFFLVELVRAWNDGEPSDSLDALLHRRVEGLLPAERRLLELVAISSQPLELTVAQRLLAGAATLERAQQSLREQRLLRLAQRAEQGTEQHALSCYHDRVRETLVAALSKPYRRALHSELSEALAALPSPDAARLSHHCFEAGLIEQAITHAEQAAQQALQKLAFGRAADLYRRVMELEQPSGARHVELSLALGDALSKAGFGKTAGEVYESALPHAATTTLPTLRRRAAECYLYAGYFEAAEAPLNAELAELELDVPPRGAPSWALITELVKRIHTRGLAFSPRRPDQIPPQQLRVLDACLCASFGYVGVQSEWTTIFMMRAVLLALDAGEPERVARALAHYVTNVAGYRRPGSRAVGAALEATERAVRRVGTPSAEAWLEVARGNVLFVNQGKAQSGARHLFAALKRFTSECVGTFREAAFTHILLGFCLHTAGRLPDMRAGAHTLRASALARGDRMSATWLHSYTASEALMRDRPDEAAEAAKALSDMSGEFDIMNANALAVQLDNDLYAGGAAAWRRLRAHTDPHLWEFIAPSFGGRLHVARARAAAAAYVAEDAAGEERAAARHAAEQQADWLIGSGLIVLAPAGMLIRAALAAHDGDHATAAHLLEEAALSCDGAEGNRLLGACARRRLGELRNDDDQMAAADESMRAQGVVAPRRWLALYTPGFVRHSRS